MFLKNVLKKRDNIFLAILIFNLVILSALFVNPIQTQACPDKYGNETKNCHSCNSAGECEDDPNGPYWCPKCFGYCGPSSDSSGTVPDVDYGQALNIATNILSEQEGSGTDIINAITSGQSGGIISGLATAFCASQGISPAICNIVLNILLSPGAGVGGTGAFTQTQEFKAPKLDQYKWEVGIPGFVPKNGVVPLEEEGVSNLIKAIINWAFKLAGIFAFAMIVWAGFEYTTSGGNTNKQKDAQTKIIGAIVGIILLFAFYIILYTINPDILKSSSGTAAPTPSVVTPPVVTPPVVTPPDQEPSEILVNIRYMGIPIDNVTFGQSEAYLDSALANKLDNLKGISPAWHVHDACINSVLPCLTTKNTRPVGDCHYYGTCVDIDSKSDDPDDNKLLIAKFNAAGLDVLDEGNHLHIALPGASGNGSKIPGSNNYCITEGCWYGAT